MKRPLHLSLAALSAGILAGCVSPSMLNPAASPLSQEAKNVSDTRAVAPSVVSAPARVVETPGPYIPVTARKVSDSPWLRDKIVNVQVGNAPMPLTEVLRVLSRQGITVTSELPLDRFTYAGFSLNQVDAETALRAILASVGLDYSADNSNKLVVIKPLASRTWYLNIGNRRSTYASGTDKPSSTAMAGAALVGSSGGGGGSSSEVNTQSTGSSTIQSAEDFWGSLKSELDSRMQVMLPEPPKPATVAATTPALALPPPVPLPPVLATGQPAPAVVAPGTPAVSSRLPAIPVPAAQNATTEGMTYAARKVGSYSVNPETGAVTVQAPHWVLSELETYFKRVQDMYNTDIVFSGELVMLSTDKKRSEGLDISAFAKLVGSYGIAYNTNALGGVTLSFPDGGNSLVPSIIPGKNAPVGPLLGISSAADGLSLFNAYLTNLGNVTTLQKPVLTTTSGVPADFRRTVTRYFNTVSQQAASGGTGSAAVGTQNTLVAQDFGTILRVNPRIDVSTGLIRAQIELVQTSQAGVQNIPQALTSGNSIQQVTTALPIVSKIIYSGETLLRDGDLVVMGGQTEDTESADRDGITGLMDNAAVGGAFGVNKRAATRNVFYFALRVKVNKR